MLNYSLSGDPLSPQLKLNPTPGCAMFCVWVDISWDWSDDAPWHEACGVAETSSPKCLSVIRGREEAHLGLGRTFVSWKFSGLQYLAQGSIFTWLYREISCVDVVLCWVLAFGTVDHIPAYLKYSVSFNEGISWFSFTYLIAACLPLLDLFLLLTHSHSFLRGEAVWGGGKNMGFGSRLGLVTYYVYQVSDLEKLLTFSELHL